MRSPERAITDIQLGNQHFSVASLLRRASDAWIVCLHGLQSNKSLFKPIFDDARFKDYSILAPDFLGFGESSKPSDNSYALKDQCELVVQVLKAHKISSCYLIGHSMGGMVGTMLLDRPEIKLKGLVSLEGNLTLEDCGTSRELAGIPLEEFSRVSYPKLKKTIKESGESSAALRAAALELIPDYVFLRASQAIVEESRSGKLLDRFVGNTIPKLLVLGAEGRFVARPTSDTIQTCIISGSAHFMLSDNPVETYSAIYEFLENLK